MNALLLDGYAKVSVLIAIIDILLAVKAWKKNKTTGHYFAYACIGAAVVDISYLISILMHEYLCVSIMSSMYFATIDVMLLCLVIFTVYYTKGSFSPAGKRLLAAGKIYTLFEIAVFAINPFWEIAVHYVQTDTIISKYAYEMKPLYWLHLAFTYGMVAAVAALMIGKMIRIPREYRAQYGYVLLGILGIVGINAVFLFSPEDSVYSLLDYSICGYSLTAFLLYWSCFNYSTHGLLNRLKMNIFESIGQGIVLFDYEDHLILCNARADALLGGIDRQRCNALSDFLSCYDLPMQTGDSGGSCSLQCYIRSGEEVRPLRCDIRSLENEREERLGQMFVFSNAVLETDLLTGFQNWDSFQMLIRENTEVFPSPTAVAVCDINSLSVINSVEGTLAGDQKIRQLAEAMRRRLPKQTYFVRGMEAILVALCRGVGERELQACMERVRESVPDRIQYATSMATKEEPDVLGAVQTAVKAMRTKKLLDRGSVHSQMLTSLIRALQECDSDTEHHVRRTQMLGAELGKRIGLTDMQQSNLSLLCLLHDIGKIGVPLEILNKPGKLSDEEWKILQAHTKKGYEIARSSQELRGIAEEILHHHERWDGRGYPDGLSGKEIPILSRVIAVVDAYDAMVNDRAYRAAMPAEKAIEELRRCAGSQFDPRITAEFLLMLRENPHETAADRESSATAEARKHLVDQEKPAERVQPGESESVHQIPHSRYLLDEAFRVVSVDDHFEEMTGYSREEIEQHPLYQSDLIPEGERTEYLCETNAQLAKSTEVYQEHRIRRKDGTAIHVFCYGRRYYDSAVRAERSEIIIADINQTYSMQKATGGERSRLVS